MKAYGVSNHNLKLQSKKLSRTRDIPNFPTQGWADTAFCTRKRSETYLSSYISGIVTLICFSNTTYHLIEIESIPVCTRSPICSSDIGLEYPFSTLTVAMAGKQKLPGKSLLEYEGKPFL